MKTISDYSYSVPRISILWSGHVQPLGLFKSASEAIEEIKKIDMYNQLNMYELCSPDFRVKVVDLINAKK